MQSGQRGVAALVVVMTLFFIVSLVAAYASRNLIFEQRTSANQYRSTQAFETAEAGIEWALGLLNAGAIDAACMPTADPAATSFRARYLTIHPETGRVNAPGWTNAFGVEQPLMPACVRDGANWACDCPTAAAPVLAAPGAGGSEPAFLIRFSSGSVPGTLVIESHGCTVLNFECLINDNTAAGEALSVVKVVVGLAPSLPTAPAAPLTARGNINVTGAIRVVNADAATNGITVNAGGAFDAPGAILQSVPGSPGGDTLISDDDSLRSRSADRMFTTFLGSSRAAFERQPATVPFTCGGGCSGSLATLVASNPGRPIWITDDLVLDSDVVIGTPERPALLVIAGGLDMAAAGSRIHGVVYSRAADATIAGAGVLHGAFIAEGNVSGVSAPNFIFEADTVNRVRLGTGSLVRVPGGWKDF